MNIPGDKVFIGKGVGQDGIQRPKDVVPRDTEQLEKYQMEENQRVEHNQQLEMNQVRMRGPANVDERNEQAFKSEITGDTEGLNILNSIKKFEIALRVNDKTEIQESIDDFDKGLAQIINSRAQVGARIQVLDHSDNSLRQNIVDAKSKPHSWKTSICSKLPAK